MCVCTMRRWSWMAGTLSRTSSSIKSPVKAWPLSWVRSTNWKPMEPKKGWEIYCDRQTSLAVYFQFNLSDRQVFIVNLANISIQTRTFNYTADFHRLKILCAIQRCYYFFVTTAGGGFTSDVFSQCAEVEQKRMQSCIHFMNLKKLNRLAHMRLKRGRDQTHEVMHSLYGLLCCCCTSFLLVRKN